MAACLRDHGGKFIKHLGREDKEASDVRGGTERLPRMVGEGGVVGVDAACVATWRASLQVMACPLPLAHKHDMDYLCLMGWGMVGGG